MQNAKGKMCVTGKIILKHCTSTKNISKNQTEVSKTGLGFGTI